MKRECLLIVVSCTMLSGCATLQLLSFGASSISYAVSGKSLSDHALSTVMDKDCALHRPLMGEIACVNHQDYGVIRSGSEPLMATLNDAQDEQLWQYVAQPIESTPKPKLASLNQMKPVVGFKTKTTIPSVNTMAKRSNPDEVVLELIKKQSQSSALQINNQQSTRQIQYQEPAKIYAVVGSFNQLRYARDNLRRQDKLAPGLTAQIITNSPQIIAKGATKYRVVVGPINTSNFDPSIGDVGDRRNYHAWRLTLCSASMQPPPCEATLTASR